MQASTKSETRNPESQLSEAAVADNDRNPKVRMSETKLEQSRLFPGETARIDFF